MIEPISTLLMVGLHPFESRIQVSVRLWYSVVAAQKT